MARHLSYIDRDQRRRGVTGNIFDIRRKGIAQGYQGIDHVQNHTLGNGFQLVCIRHA